jgi:hypothetical protein
MEVSGWVLPPYAETNKQSDRERVLETRLVLSQDVGPFNLAFNWINETDLKDGLTAFGYSAGLMWMRHPGGGDSTSHEDVPRTEAPAASGYSCPMHPDVKVSTPGTCPKCGMALAAVSAPGSGAETGTLGEAEPSPCPCRLKMKGCHCAHCSGRGGKCTCAHEGGAGVGMEIFGALGDTKSFGLRPARQQHYLGPILMYHVSSHLMVHAQLALGLSKASDHLGRVNIGYEF